MTSLSEQPILRKHAWTAFCLGLVIAIQRPTVAEGPVILEAETLANPLKVFHDPTASGKKCLAEDITVEKGMLLKASLDQRLTPGLYSARFLLRISSRTEPLAKSLVLTATVADGQRTLTYLNLDDAKEYQSFGLQFELTKADAPNIQVTWTHHPEVYKEALGETVSKEKTTNIVPDVLRERTMDDGEGDEELAILKGGKPLSEAGRLYVALDRITIEPVTSLAAVRSIYPEKIHYEPGTETWADVTVRNYQAAKLDAEVALDMVWELGETRGLAKQTVALDPGAKTVVRFPFNVGKEEYGRELRATLLAGGKPIHAASEYFAVSDQVWKVGISGRGWPAGGSYGWRDRVDSLVKANRESYANFYEEFAWAPSDYDDMTPDTEEFWSGQTQYHGTVTDCKAVIDGLHKHGIKAITYGKSCGGGLPGFETLRKHPDWYWRDPAGMGIEGGPEVDFLDRMRALDYSLAAKDGWQSWQGTWVDSRVEAAVRFGAEEIIRSTDLLKWDGIRWDGHFMTESDETTARNSKVVKEIIWKKYPRFLHGYNYLNPQYSDKEAAVNEFPSVPQLLDFEECCRDGGLIMNEGLRDFSNRNFSHRIMWVFAEAMALEGDWVHALGGYYLAIGFDRATNLDSLYNHIFCMAAGARPYGQGGLTSVGHFWQFATRYSCLVYNNTRRRIARPEQFITVESPWPVWWNKHVFFRALDGPRRQILVNVIGKPETERFNELRQPPPPLQKDVKIRFRLPQGWSAVKAYQVSVELDGYQRELKLEQTAGETVLTMPETRYWSIAVLDLDEKPGAAAIRFTDPVGDARRGLARKQQEQAEAERKAAEDAKIRAPGPEKAPEATTDQQRLAKSTVARIDDPVLLRNGVVDILLAKGVFHWMYEVEEAIGWAGGAAITEAKINKKGGWFQGTEASMPDMPKSFNEIRQLDVVVMNNVPAAYMTLDQRYAIERFVHAGGGLLVIGGEWSLDRGGFQNSFLEPLLPVTMSPPDSSRPTIHKDGLPLRLTERLRLKDPVAWDASPHIFCLHHLTPKPEASVLWTAGDQPLVVEWLYGKGKVIVFSGSTMGMVPDRKLPFWHWDGLPVLLAELLERLADGSAQVTREKPPDVDRDKAMENVINLADMEAKEQMRVIRDLCSVCDKDAARGLIGIVGTATQFPAEAYGLMARAVRPFVDKSFETEAQDAAKSEIREAKAVGTSLLGLAVGEGARDMLTERLNDMDIGIQRAAAVGLGDLRSPRSIEPLANKLKEIRGKAVADEEGMSDLAGLEHDLVVALYQSGHKPALGDLIGANERAAAQIVRFERRREALLEHAGTAFKLTPREYRQWQAQIQRCGERKVWWRDECRRLAGELRQIPTEWLDVVFERAATVNEPASVSLVCEVLKRLNTAESAPRFVPLVTARNTVIRMLALQRVLRLGTEADREKARENLMKLVSGTHHFDRLYLLRRLRLLNEAQRMAVLSELLKDIQPEVRTTARAMLYLVTDGGRRAELGRIHSPYDPWVVLD